MYKSLLAPLTLDSLKIFSIELAKSFKKPFASSHFVAQMFGAEIDF